MLPHVRTGAEQHLLASQVLAAKLQGVGLVVADAEIVGVISGNGVLQRCVLAALGGADDLVVALASVKLSQTC